MGHVERGDRVRHVRAPATWSWQFHDGRRELGAMLDAARRAHWNPDDMPWDYLSDEPLSESARFLLSQALHASQVLLLLGGELVGSLPPVDAKMVAGSEVADDARQIEALTRLLARRAARVEPPAPALARVTGRLLAEPSWIATLLGGHLLEYAIGASLRRVDDSGPLLRILVAQLGADHVRHSAFATYILRQAMAELDEEAIAELSRFAGEVIEELIAALAAGPSPGAARELARELDLARGRLGLR